MTRSQPSGEDPPSFGNTAAQEGRALLCPENPVPQVLTAIHLQSGQVRPFFVE